MTQIETPLEFSLTSGSFQHVLNICKTDYDSRVIVASFRSGSEIYSLDGITRIILRAKKPDGSYLYTSCRKAGDTAEYIPGRVILAVPGEVQCQFVLIGGNGEEVSSPKFKINVTSPVMEDDELTGLSDYSALTEFASDAEEYASRAEAAAVVSETYAAEATSAAGEVQTTATTLNSKLAEITAALEEIPDTVSGVISDNAQSVADIAAAAATETATAAAREAVEEAGEYASEASGYASTASAKALAAGQSATSASQSAASATQSAASATQSAASASQSATNAGLSETAAETAAAEAKSAKSYINNLSNNLQHVISTINGSIDDIDEAMSLIEEEIDGFNDLADNYLTLTPATLTENQKKTARSNIGIPGDYVLLENFVVSEDTTQVYRDKFTDGTDYDIYNLIVTVELPSVQKINFQFQATNGNSLCFMSSTTAKNRFVLRSFMQCGQRLTMMSEHTGSFTTGGIFTMYGGITSQTIGALQVNSQVGDYVIPEGTRIKIYGVKS